MTAQTQIDKVVLLLLLLLLDPHDGLQHHGGGGWRHDWDCFSGAAAQVSPSPTFAV